MNNLKIKLLTICTINFYLNSVIYFGFSYQASTTRRMFITNYINNNLRI